MRSHPYLRLVSLIQAIGALGLWWGASPAEACSPPASPQFYFTFGESHPANGATNLPVDAAILLTSRGVPTQNGGFTDNPLSFREALAVTVTDTDTGAPVPGRLEAWWGQAAGVVWLPQDPLRANGHFELVGTLHQRDTRPEAAEGPTEIRLTFSTGSQQAAPLELLGELQVRLEQIETDTFRCTYKCGEPCEKDGTAKKPHARIQLPGVQGGAALGAYRFEIWITDQTPMASPPKLGDHKVILGSHGVNSTGDATDTLIQMPEHDEDYKPCFTWRVIDPTGRSRSGVPVCLDETVEPPGFLGCTVSPGSRSSQGMAFLFFLAVTAIALRSRRRVT